MPKRARITRSARVARKIISAISNDFPSVSAFFFFCIREIRDASPMSRSRSCSPLLSSFSFLRAFEPQPSRITRLSRFSRPAREKRSISSHSLSLSLSLSGIRERSSPSHTLTSCRRASPSMKSRQPLAASSSLSLSTRARPFPPPLPTLRESWTRMWKRNDRAVRH